MCSKNETGNMKCYRWGKFHVWAELKQQKRNEQPVIPKCYNENYAIYLTAARNVQLCAVYITNQVAMQCEYRWYYIWIEIVSHTTC